MTKKQIKQEYNGDWFDLAGKTKQEAIKYLQQLPDNVEFDINWHGYDGADGMLTFMREETDKEYEARIEQEKEDAEEALAKAEKKRKEQQKKVNKEIKELEDKLRSLKNG